MRCANTAPAQFGKDGDVGILGLAGEPVCPAGDVAEVANGGLGQLLLIGEEPFEHDVGQRLFKLQAYEFLAVPDDPAELRLEAGDAEPDPAVLGESRRAIDAAAARRHVDDPDLDPAARAVAHRRGEPERDALGAPAIGLLALISLSHCSFLTLERHFAARVVNK